MTKSPSGRPTKYKEKYNEQARKLCLMGYTDKELADFFEVAESTINKWKLDYPIFSESLKAGKVVADAEVTASLYHRAIGYEHEETKVFCSNGDIIKADVMKKYPPDPLSAKYWLNNRQPDRWREKVEIDDGKDKETPPLVVEFNVNSAKNEVEITRGTDES